MYCCENCFCDFFLKSIIASIGITNNCDFCGSTDVFCIKPAKIEGYFRPLIDLYSPIEKIVHPEELPEYKGHKIWDKIHQDWHVFNESIKVNRRDLLRNILAFPIANGACEITDSCCEIPFFYYGFEDEEAKRLETEWAEFTDEVKLRNRFFPSIKLDLEQLENLFKYIVKKITKDIKLYRARRTDDGTKLPPSQMGKPPIEKATNGRANPVGISYLYLASDVSTAIAEIRPSIKDFITIGQFTVNEEIKIVDLRDISPFQFTQDEDFETIVYKIGYLKKLGDDLSKPINNRRADLDYLPTQYLCEFIKNCNWDGVAYKSYLEDGYNIALFHDDKIKCYKSDLYQVDKSSHTYILIKTLNIK